MLESTFFITEIKHRSTYFLFMTKKLLIKKEIRRL